MTGELLSGIVSTLIGTLIGFFFGDLAGRHPMLATVGLATTAIVAMAILYFGHDVVSMARRTRVALAATWDSNWMFEAPTGEVRVKDVVELRQVGRLVRGKGTSVHVEGTRHTSFEYGLRAIADSDGVVSGSWWATKASADYRGQFMLRPSRDGQLLEGVWIGTAESGHRAGTWKWRRRA